jgi:hypothetical protein
LIGRSSHGQAGGDTNYPRRLMPATSKGSLFESLHAVQAAALSISKNARNPHFGNKYISLDKLVPQVLPLLNANGLVLTQLPTNLGVLGEPSPALRTRLTHAPTGEFIEDTAPLLLDKQNSQGVGSAITYMRRYALLSILGLVADEDDDGEKASKSERKVEVVNKRRKSASKAEAVAPGADDSDEDY